MIHMGLSGINQVRIQDSHKLTNGQQVSEQNLARSGKYLYGLEELTRQSITLNTHLRLRQ